MANAHISAATGDAESSSLRALRAEVQEWLAEALPDEWRRRPFPQFLAPADDDVAAVRTSRGWHKRLHRDGWVAPGWPIEYGGRGLGLRARLVIAEELASACAPVPIGVAGLDLLGPTLIEHASAELKARLLPGTLAGDVLWCQGYSEPDAGSDLASLRTTARPEGDGYVINGQKVWTSFGNRSQWCFLLARTGPPGSRHSGISFFVFEMSTPGVEWRPIREINGSEIFGELFLTDAFVPAHQRVGPEGEGWRVAMSSLGHERILGANVAHERVRMRALIGLAQRLRPLSGANRDRVAHLHARMLGLEGILGSAVAAAEVDDRRFPMWTSLLKLAATELRTDMADTALGLLGLHAASGVDSAELDAWAFEVIDTRSGTIYAGTSEVQRNIIAERGLGLMKEPT